MKKFPDEFYENIYKPKGWIGRGWANRYSVVAYYTRDLVYERMAAALLEELEKKSPKNEKGQRTSLCCCPSSTLPPSSTSGLLRNCLPLGRA